MRQVKLKTIMANASGCYNLGQVISVSDDEAKALIEGGFAADVTPKRTYETAAVEQPEKAVRPKPRKKKVR